MVKNTKGFTMIELLTAMAIVSILSAVALPHFSSYKYRAFNARSVSDLQQALKAEEALYTEEERYFNCVNIACETILPDFVLSAGSQIAVVTSNNNQRFTITVSNAAGDKTYLYDSTTSTTSSS